MPKLPRDLSGREVVKALQKFGWVFARQTGSHIILEKKNFKYNVSVPDHKVLDTGTLRSIIRKTAITVEEFVNAL